MEQCYEVGSWLQFSKHIDVNGTEIGQDAYGVKIHCMRLKAETQIFQLTPARRKEISSRYRKEEQFVVRTMSGKLGYLSVCALPVSAFASSFIQQLLLEMNESGVKLANGIERDALIRTKRLIM